MRHDKKFKYRHYSDDNLDKYLLRLHLKQQELEGQIKDINNILDDYNIELNLLRYEIQKWEKRDIFLYRIYRFYYKNVFRNIRHGVRVTITLITKIIVIVVVGIVTGYVLNNIGHNSIIKNVINFFNKIF